MIIAYIGDIGSGKTLSMTKYIIEGYQKGRQVFTNYKLDFLGLKTKGGKINYLDKEFFKNYASSRFDIINSIVAIDEISVYFDSRCAMMKKNKLFSRFIWQSRKRSVDLIYTAQDLSPESFLSSGNVELRLRKLTDYIVMCEAVKIKGETYISNQWCNNKGIPMLPKKPYLAKPFYRFYNTNEIIDFEYDDENN